MVDLHVHTCYSLLDGMIKPEELIEKIKSQIPMLANERKEKYMKEYSLSEYDASVLVKNKKISDYFEECVNSNCDPKSACNWITTRLLGEINKSDEITIDNIFIRPNMIVELVNLVNDKKISSDQAKKVFTKMLEESSKDEVYWEHIDRVVVDKLGLPFERDYTNNGQVISESRLKLKEDKNERNIV